MLKPHLRNIRKRLEEEKLDGPEVRSFLAGIKSGLSYYRVSPIWKLSDSPAEYQGIIVDTQPRLSLLTGKTFPLEEFETELTRYFNLRGIDYQIEEPMENNLLFRVGLREIVLPVYVPFRNNQTVPSREFLERLQIEETRFLVR